MQFCRSFATYKYMTMCTKALSIAKKVLCPPGANFMPIQTENEYENICVVATSGWRLCSGAYRWMASRRDVSHGGSIRAGSSFSAGKTACRRTLWIWRCSTTNKSPPSEVLWVCNLQVDTCSCNLSTNHFADTINRVDMSFRREVTNATHFIEYPCAKYCLKQIVKN